MGVAKDYYTKTIVAMQPAFRPIASDEIIRINSIEEFGILPSGGARPRIGGGWLSILFVQKGGGVCRRGNEVLLLEERTVYTGLADCFRQFELYEGTTGYLIAIDLDRLGSLLDSVTIAFKDIFVIHRPCLRLGAESVDEMDWLVSRILKKMRLEQRHRTEIVQKYVSLLLLHLSSEIKDEWVLVSMDRKRILIKDFFALLEDEFVTGKTVDYYADKLSVTAKHLTNVIKTESGYPTSYHINQRIVAEAKRIVQATGASLKQIAYELGYDDTAAFSKLFKRVSGENFSSYKHNLRLAVRNPATVPAMTGNSAMV